MNEVLVTVLMYVFSVLGIAAVVYMLLKKLDIKMTLLAVGMVLIVLAMLLGKVEVNSISTALLPFAEIVTQLRSILPAAGLIILVLGGYTSYMSYIGANEVTVNTLTKPLKRIKSVYILVPIVFLIGNLLSLVIPSASQLAIILLATLYPVLRKAGMSSLTAAAIIATTATVMPTPLGSDNIAVAEAFGISVVDYVYNYHAIVSIPTLIFMAVVHYFWQKYADRKDLAKLEVVNETDEVKTVEEEEEVTVKEVPGGILYKTIYTILPLLPIIILLLFFAINQFLPTDNQISLGVELVTLICFFIAIICELIRKRRAKVVLEGTESYFKGVANALSVVMLMVAAGVFVRGLTYLGVIAHLQETMQNTNVAGFVLPLILVVFTAIIVLLSGSGTSLFFAMIPLMIPLAVAAGISEFAVAIPMGLAGNLLRAVSPVSAVILIVAGTTKKEPFKIVKRTAVPMVAGVVFMFVLSMILFL